ncbi:nuclear distribution protein nudE homolog isoform X1 [Drosophila novamexicana]|uniref:nuclear distribution protein nudE homolog isoform X1 n=1 Tax=Drosophila novamexicana TaxID=47314 RepID=UPI0011E5931E|nr:nuclear distribution protein nudE homolog isoform X1 [Drosophila novamexicana]XP_030570403.1 nuclear distribution protein nudE homolog isoform X1 [Drosophila novamexicana]XP_030570404.1 nuclear distribution protein nudE homolog isoform X1 [Drosophila novamexicana]
MEAPPMFNSVEDECRYWKERSKQYHKEWTDVKQEYDEYVEQSREMEAEMDATLEQKQSIIKDLRAKLNMLEKENDSLKLKLDSHGIEMSNLDKQLEAVKKERDSMKEYLRQLEQKNDDLERAHRILNESIVDFEKMLDKAYEKNALLEMEVDEKEMLQEKLQRLMDETRDLKQELNVKSRYTPANGTAASAGNSSMNSSASLPNGILANGDILLQHDNAATKASSMSVSALNGSLANKNEYNQQQHSLKNPENLINGNAMNASSRTTALNIVADMLRKLNWDNALLCPECQKFRCICERASLSSVSETSLFRRAFGSASGSSAGGGSLTTPSSDGGWTDCNAAQRRGSLTSLQFGTNIFKRFAERMRSIQDSEPVSEPPVL